MEQKSFPYPTEKRMLFWRDVCVNGRLKYGIRRFCIILASFVVAAAPALGTDKAFGRFS